MAPTYKHGISNNVSLFSVYMFPVPEDKSGQQVVDSLQKQVEQLGAIKTGNFYVDCETYQSNAQIGIVENFLWSSLCL